MKKVKQIISAEAAEEFTRNLSQIMGGGYQQILWADKQGIPEALGLELPEWVQRIGGYIKYSLEERRRIAHELRANGEKGATIAAVLGVDPETVSLDLNPKSRALKQESRARYYARKHDRTVGEKEPKEKEIDRPDEGPSDQIIAWAEQDGRESLIWQKIKDRVIPFWEELVELLEEDERSHLLETIYHQLGNYEIKQK